MKDQTKRSRRALTAMFPAVWDDIDWCAVCGAEVDPTEAHDPHEDDCPRITWGANYCSCSRVTCPGCCPECAAPPPYEVGVIRGLFIAAVIVLSMAVLAWTWWTEPTNGDGRCPDYNGACIYDPGTDD